MTADIMKNEDIFNKADAAYRDGDFREAFELFLKAAKSGDESAMDRVASMYVDAEGVEYNFDEAVSWYQRAVQAGCVCSSYNLGVIYRSKGNILKAKYWFEKAVEEGYMEAALELAKLYMISEKEKENVIFYLRKAVGGSEIFEDALNEAKDFLSIIQKTGRWGD